MSMALKYNMQKKAKKMNCGGKMAEGGDVESPEQEEANDAANKPGGQSQAGAERLKKVSDSFMGSEGYAAGGFVEEEEASGYQPEYDMDKGDMDMISHIMKNREMRMSKGGEVSNDTGEGQDADKKPNEFDELVLDSDAMDDADYTGENSGDEEGNEALDDEDSDMVSDIMKSRKKKDRLPNPR